MFWKTTKQWPRIIKGTSPTMRHASRAYRVALDWLSDRINLDSKIQIKYADTKDQLAEILTKGSFTRDEWNHLFHVCSISWASQSLRLAIFTSISYPKTMSKRLIRGRKTRGRWTRGCKINQNQCGIWCRRLSFDWSPTVLSLSTSHSLGGIYSKRFKFGSHWYGEARGPIEFSRQSDVNPSSSAGDTCCQDDKEPRWYRIVSPQYDNIPEQRRPLLESLVERTTKTWSSTAWDRRQHGDLGNIHVRDNEGGGTSWTRLSRTFTYHQEDGLRQDQTFIFFTGNWSWIKIKKCMEYLRYIGIQLTGWEVFCWTTKAVNLSTAKVYVFSHSLLCLGGRIAGYPRSVASWEDKIEWFTQSPEYRELGGVDGEPFVIEWTPFPASTTLQLLQEVQRTMEESNIRLENSKVESSSCLCTTKWRKLYSEFFKCCCVRRNISQRTLVILRTWNWRKMVLTHKPNGSWNNVADLRMINFRESGHPLCRGKSALFRGIFEKQKWWKTSMHYNGDPASQELLLGTRTSVNQVSIFGAVADWCEALCPADSRSFCIWYRESCSRSEQGLGISSCARGCIDPDQITFDQCVGPGKCGAAT